MTDESKPRIELRPDGPILVRNLPRLIGPRGALEVTEVVALCRCGGSENKPYCDGSHKRNGFSATCPAARAKKERAYPGAGILVHDDRTLCSHSAECVRGLPAVFRPGERPWIQPEAAASVDEIVRTIRRCPTGALSYTLTTPDGAAEGAQVRDFGLDAAIRVRADGPYEVRGGIPLEVPPEQQPATLDHYSLCRCGASRNKPYCDGSHAEAGFEG